MLKSKDKFFDIFKLWLSRTKAFGSKLDCFQTNGGESLLVLLFKPFTENEKLKLDILHLIYMKKIV